MKLVQRIGYSLIPLSCAALLLSGCASNNHQISPQPSSTLLCKSGESQVNTYLFFGLNRPHGSKITEKEWEGFLNNQVTPQFKDGLTVYTAAGQWLGNNGKLAKETTKVLMLLHSNSQQVEEKIQTISHYYQQKFEQDAVMRVDHNVCVSFFTTKK